MRKLALYTFAVAAALNAVGIALAAEQLSSAEGFVKEVVAAIGNKDQAAREVGHRSGRVQALHLAGYRQSCLGRQHERGQILFCLSEVQRDRHD